MTFTDPNSRKRSTRNKPFRLIGASTYQLERYIPAWVLR
ncbi:hypothetical protein BOVA514_48 [Bacteroides ovatus]|nr:hypothetical protein M117_4880 [Bacteroides fragilis str. 3774 T13]EXZ76284.1 hypothetical protein M144_4525 [Bacteroides fragilis str. 3-F-2 \